MVTLEDLEREIRTLDPERKLDGVAYSTTYNSKLGLGKENDPFGMCIFIPFGTWNQYDKKDPQLQQPTNVLADAFKEIIDAGFSEGADQTCFIDIAMLDEPGKEFMTEETFFRGLESYKSSPIRHLAEAVNKKRVKPIIRFLVGGSHQQTPSNFTQFSAFRDLFWPNGESIFTHEEATLLVGYYNPSLKLNTKSLTNKDSKVDSINAWLDVVSSFSSLASVAAAGLPAKLASFLKNLSPRLEEIVKFARNNELPALSWNHAKFTAVNGKSMMTGGYNFWDEYKSTNETLFDFGIKVQGDAAITAHQYADYVWKYLADPHETDANSMAWQTKLKIPVPSKFEVAAGEDVPIFGQIPKATTGIKVFTTCRLGDMRVDNHVYPAQLLDAFRDILLNAGWYASDFNDPASNFAATLAEIFSDNSVQMMLARLVGTTPAVWASKHARLHAIANATQSVHMTSQCIVDYFLAGKPEWKDPKGQNGVVDAVNRVFGLSDNQQWQDGWIWPFDLFVAMAKALSRIAKHSSKPPAATSDAQQKPSESAIYLVLSTPGHYYGDLAKVSDIKERLRRVMGTLAKHHLLPEETRPEDVPEIIEERVMVKRIMNGESKYNLHAKIVCIDRKLLYVGSDNSYPHYNEEFGCWLEEPENVKAFMEQYYDGLWARSTFTKD